MDADGKTEMENNCEIAGGFSSRDFEQLKVDTLWERGFFALYKDEIIGFRVVYLLLCAITG